MKSIAEQGSRVVVEFMESDEEPKKATIIKASRILQAKIGAGPLDAKVLRRCENVMVNADIDFGPLAHEYLTKLKNALRQARAGELLRADAVNALTEPVMQLKAHAAMFRYPMIGALANIMLGFLESTETVDEGVLDIVDAHHRSWKTIISKKMEGDGGTYGKQLQTELADACKRYLARKKT